MTSLRRLLVGPGIDGSAPLFKSGLKLAEEVSALEFIEVPGNDRIPNKFFDRLSTTTTYINESFRDEKALPEDLGAAVLAVSKAKLAKRFDGGTDTGLGEKWLNRIKGAMGLDPQRNIIAPYPDLDEVLEETLRLADRSLDHCIVSSELCDAYLCGELHGFRHVLIHRLSLNSTGEFTTPTCRYTFFVPSEEAAHATWRSLLFSVAEASNGDPSAELTAAEIHKRLRVIDESGALRIYAVAPEHCVFPLICLEPEMQQPAGFNVFLVESQRLSVLPIPPPYLKLWLKRVYTAVVGGRIGCPVRYSDLPAALLESTLARDRLLSKEQRQ